VRARSLLDGPPANLAPLPGSELSGTSTQLSLDGQTTRCATYDAPGRTVQSLLEHFRELAASQTPDDSPYLEAVQPGGATLVWVDSGLQRRGVILDEGPQGDARYRLLWSGPPTPDAKPSLPLGIAPPVGCDVVTSALSPDGGTALLATVGEPSTAAHRVARSLEASGFTLETELPEDPRRVAFSFRSPTHAGLCVAAAGERGQVRVSLSLRPAR
jgi:hypothetical protein